MKTVAGMEYLTREERLSDVQPVKETAQQNLMNVYKHLMGDSKENRSQTLLGDIPSTNGSQRTQIIIQEILLKHNK